MNFLRNHWYDLGGTMGVIILVFLLFSFQKMTGYQLLMWLNLTTLLFHQMEEYRIAGTFPGMINSTVFKSECPDRYPLNSNTALVINVYIGWTVYLLAALAGKQYIWLGMATILVSLGNIVAHTFLFNIKGKTLYNAGLATSWVCFAPCVYFFFKIIHQEDLVRERDYLIGIPLGIAINVFGVFQPIKWLANKNTTFTFRRNQLLPHKTTDL